MILGGDLAGISRGQSPSSFLLPPPLAIDLGTTGAMPSVKYRVTESDHVVSAKLKPTEMHAAARPPNHGILHTADETGLCWALNNLSTRQSDGALHKIRCVLCDRRSASPGVGRTRETFLDSGQAPLAFISTAPGPRGGGKVSGGTVEGPVQVSFFGFADRLLAPAPLSSFP